MSRLRKALEMAREARTSAGLGASLAPPEGVPPPEHAERVEIEYSATRVQAVNPESLLQSKVLSVLHAGLVSNQVKILRTQVLNRLAETGGNTLLLTSAGPREGKTFTAMNLAVSISYELSRTVLLVDADLRKPSLHDYFHLGSPPGLSDYLLGKGELANLLVNPGIPKLTLLPAGNSLDNSSELLGSPRMRALVAEMKERYPDRILLFDCPSVLTSADALVFTQYVDGVILVVEAEGAQRRDVVRTLELLADRPVFGIVLNKFRDLR